MSYCDGNINEKGDCMGYHKLFGKCNYTCHETKTKLEVENLGQPTREAFLKYFKKGNCVGNCCKKFKITTSVGAQIIVDNIEIYSYLAEKAK